MAKRHTSRQAARRRPGRAHHAAHQSRYRRKLRYEPLEHRRLLALVTVDTLDDMVDLTDGRTSLREAIFATNLVSGPDTIEFSPALTGNVPSTILLTHGELRITDDLTINGPGADLLTIDASGNDSTPAIDDAKGSRVFNIDDGLATSIEVTFKGLSFTGGDALGVGGAILSVESLVIDNCKVVENTVQSAAFTGGGGIAASLRDGAHFEMSNSIVSNNQASLGGGILLIVGTNCIVRIDDSRISGNHVPLMGVADGGGIAIYDNLGSVNITDSDILDNSARNGGGIAFSGNVTIERSSISGNSSLSSGGGIIHRRSADRFGALTLVDSEVANNAAENGGGIYLSQVASTPHKIVRSKILENTATDNMQSSNFGGYGGGILTSQGALKIVESTIEGNHARNGGGVAYFFVNAESLMENTTISRNWASIDGGGVWVGSMSAASLPLFHTTIAANTADHAGGGIFASQGNVALKHSIVADNTAPSGRDLSGLLGATIQAHYTLIGSNQNSGFAEAPIGSPDASGNLIGGPTLADRINPGLHALANNGGPTPTHALMPDSPAIDMGDPAAVAGVGGVPQFDQRGEPFTRVSGGRIDIGAFESQPNPLIGDYNFDGTVDSADYAVWRNTRNSTSDLRADGNGDSIVDEMDRLVWRSNFGRSVEPMAASADNDSLAVDRIAAAALDETFDHNLDVPGESAGAVDHLPVIVTTLLDVVDFNDGLTSLREAIFATNLVSGPDVIEFAPALTADGPATILLTQGELRITDDLTITGPGADLLTIDANGNDPTPDVNDGKGSRVLNIVRNSILEHKRVSLSRLKFTGGDVNGSGGAVLSGEILAIQDCTIMGNFSALDGGGIFADIRGDDRVDMTNVNIFENSAYGDGGGIYFRISTFGAATIKNSLVHRNICGDQGGGVTIANQVGTASINDSRIYDNQAGTEGGGIAIVIQGGTASINDSEIHNNQAGIDGGGIAFDGDLTFQRCAIIGNSSGNRGGGISNGETGTLYDIVQLIDSEVSNNSSHSGGGLFLSGGNITVSGSVIRDNGSQSGMGGGGLFLDLNTKTVISDSRISNNVSDTQGGGILNSGKELSIIRCDVSSNSADGDGGGIWNERPLISIIESQITNNTANSGGGIWTSHDLAISESLIANNIAHGNRANLEGAGNGGGILISFGKLFAQNSTISGNVARTGGGTHGTSLLEFCTVTQNIGGGVVGYSRFDHSIIAGNKSSDGGTLDASGIVNSNFSLIGLGAESLGPLVDNGGPTLTHALLPSSPAIDAGYRLANPGSGNVPLFDQRGEPFTREYGGRIDIGAFEWQPSPLTGDYNFDGMVDTADYALWRNTFGSTTDLRADGNADGVVDQVDHEIWRANFGRTLPVEGIVETGADALFAGENAVAAWNGELPSGDAELASSVVDLFSSPQLIPRPSIAPWQEHARLAQVVTNQDSLLSERSRTSINRPQCENSEHGALDSVAWTRTKRFEPIDEVFEQFGSEMNADPEECELDGTLSFTDRR